MEAAPIANGDSGKADEDGCHPQDEANDEEDGVLGVVGDGDGGGLEVGQVR